MPKLSITYCLLCLTILLLPWYVVRFNIIDIPTTLLEVVALVSILAWLGEMRPYLYNRHWVLSLVKPHIWLLVWVALLLAAATISITVSPDHRSALGQYKAYFIEPMLLCLLTVDVIRRDYKRWRGLLMVLFATATEIIIVGLSQLIFSWPNLAPAELAQGRISSFYNTANAVGLFIAPLIIIAYFYCRYSLSTSTLVSKLAWVWFLIANLVLIVSQSEAAIITVTTLVLMSEICRWLVKRICITPPIPLNKFKKIIVISLSIYVVACLVFVFIFNHPPTVVNPYTRPGFSTFTVRQCLWQGTIGLLQESPLLGAGLAGFSQAYLDHATCDAEPLVYPHLLVLNFWAEIGIVGLIGIIGLIGWWLVKSMELALKRPWMGLGLGMAMAYWLIHGLVDVPYFKNDLAMLWWLLLALLLSGQVVVLNTSTE